MLPIEGRMGLKALHKEDNDCRRKTTMVTSCKRRMMVVLNGAVYVYYWKGDTSSPFCSWSKSGNAADDREISKIDGVGAKTRWMDRRIQIFAHTHVRTLTFHVLAADRKHFHASTGRGDLTSKQHHFRWLFVG